MPDSPEEKHGSSPRSAALDLVLTVVLVAAAIFLMMVISFCWQLRGPWEGPL